MVGTTDDRFLTWLAWLLDPNFLLLCRHQPTNYPFIIWTTLWNKKTAFSISRYLSNTLKELIEKRKEKKKSIPTRSKGEIQHKTHNSPQLFSNCAFPFHKRKIIQLHSVSHHHHIMQKKKKTFFPFFSDRDCGQLQKGEGNNCLLQTMACDTWFAQRKR